jgi:hypothetical protein
MVYNSFVLKTRIFSVCVVIIAATLAIASLSLLTYTPGFAAPALIPVSAGAIKVNAPLKEVCLVPANSQAGFNTLQSKNVGSCTVSTSTSLSALDVPKSSSAIDPLSFSVATLESMRWRIASKSNALPTALQRAWAAEAPSLTIEAAIYNSKRSGASSNNIDPLSPGVAALESMRWRTAALNAPPRSSENPLSFSVAALESMRWRLASNSQIQDPR